MKISVGSKNKTRLKAVIDAVVLYPKLFPNPEIIGVDTAIALYGHPISIKETVAGAVQRAKDAFHDCAYSFGLEGGLMEVPLSKSGFMEISVCAIYNGKAVHLGISPAFEWPKKVTDMVVKGIADASTAFKQLGLTQQEKLGAMEGGITGFLTHGRLTREASIVHSIIM
ncbi:DUF84 family protein, partial [Candidatus Uhrbacteria bacterium]|nr:DUF84 family protein [Candidatus Uhrbacteria bacterium]